MYKHARWSLILGMVLAVAVSGVAGPGGGSDEKPVGTVYLAWVGPGPDVRSERCHFAGDRDQVRRAAAGTALAGLLHGADVGA